MGIKRDSKASFESPLSYFISGNQLKIKMEKSSSLTYKILLHKEPEGSYTVTVPALPGCIIYGDNIDHAIEMAKETVELYIAELKATGQKILTIVKLEPDLSFQFLRILS